MVSQHDFGRGAHHLQLLGNPRLAYHWIVNALAGLYCATDMIERMWLQTDRHYSTICCNGHCYGIALASDHLIYAAWLPQQTSEGGPMRMLASQVRTNQVVDAVQCALTTTLASAPVTS